MKELVLVYSLYSVCVQTMLMKELVLVYSLYCVCVQRVLIEELVLVYSVYRELLWKNWFLCTVCTESVYSV